MGADRTEERCDFCLGIEGLESILAGPTFCRPCLDYSLSHDKVDPHVMMMDRFPSMFPEAHRLLPKITFSVTIAPCVVCKGDVIATGVVPLCSKECVAEWAKVPHPKFSDEDEVLVEQLTKEIHDNIMAVLADDSRPTNKEIVQAACDAVIPSLDIITVTGKVSV